MHLRWLSGRAIDIDHITIITERNSSSFHLCAL